jgi:hypothetical protein
VAPERFSPVLAMEVEIVRWPSEAVGGHSAVDQRNQLCQPALGCSENSRRLLKLGIDVGQTSVAKYMARNRRPPSQGWKTFLRNHANGIVDRPVCCPDHLVPTAVWVAHSETRPPRNPVSFSNGTSERRVDQPVPIGNLNRLARDSESDESYD